VLNDQGFKIIESGEWVNPELHGMYHKCCGCGLMHKVNFRISFRLGRFSYWVPWRRFHLMMQWFRL
jgi:hypothetical protein